jgi:cysteine synthase
MQHSHWFLTSVSAIIMPDDVSDDKAKALLALGATVERVRPASIVDKRQVLADFKVQHPQ